MLTNELIFNKYSENNIFILGWVGSKLPHLWVVVMNDPPGKIWYRIFGHLLMLVWFIKKLLYLCINFCGYTIQIIQKNRWVWVIKTLFYYLGLIENTFIMVVLDWYKSPKPVHYLWGVSTMRVGVMNIPPVVLWSSISYTMLMLVYISGNLFYLTNINLYGSMILPVRLNYFILVCLITFF